MKTPEEIKKELEHSRIETSRAAAAFTNAIAYIQELEEQVMCMKIQMRGDCGVCKHRSGLNINAWAITMSKTCEECIMQESRPNWEYEGLPELPKKGATK